MHSSINELGLFNPLLIWSYRLALKSKIVLELSNISVVRDFPDIFTEVSPGRPLTDMLSSWSSWFSNKPPLLQESVLDIPELVGQAKQQLGELEDKRLSNLVHFQRDILCLCVCWRKMISSLIDPRDQLLDLLSYPNLWFAYGLSSNQVRTNDMHNVVLLVVDPSSIHHYILWYDRCYHHVHIVMELHLYGNLDELLLSPLTTFSSCPWFMLNI